MWRAEYFKPSSYSSRRDVLTTDDVGRFSVAVRRPDPKEIRQVTLIRWDRTGAEGFQHGLRAVIDLPHDLKEGANDMGEVILNDEIALVTGTVTNAQGQPIANALVRSEPQSVRNARVTSDMWRVENTIHARTDANGAFRVEGPAIFETLLLRASADGHEIPATQTVVTPGEDVSLVIRPTGTLLGRVHIEPEFLENLQIGVTLADGRVARERVAKDGSFRFPILPIEPVEFFVAVWPVGIVKTRSERRRRARGDDRRWTVGPDRPDRHVPKRRTRRE